MTADHLPQPGPWEVTDRSPVAVVWQHPDGVTARVIPDGPDRCTFEIDGDEIFEVTDRRTNEPQLWEKVGAALEGWPDNVEAHRKVGNAGLSAFGGGGL